MPHFRELTHEECVALLRQETHGRLAFSFHDRVDIEPLHFVYHDGWLYVRTAAGTKLTTLAHHPWVAFEVDDVDGLFSWRSVVARGTVWVTHPDDDQGGTTRYADAVRILQRLVPQAFTADDPVPDRTVILRIHVDELHGRAAAP